jgi:SnoaL-like protein
LEPWETAIRESVRQTLADYTAATDAFDLAALASCFTSEGALEFTGGGAPLVGPAQIEAGLWSQLSQAPSRKRPSYVRHHVSSIRFVRAGADEVETSSYFAVFTDIGVDHWGRYRDVLRPEDARWLFVSRKIRVDGFAANSLMNNTQ